MNKRFYFLFLVLVVLTPFVSATINDNGLTYTSGGNQLTSGFNITINQENIDIVNITKVSGETAPNAYVLYTNGTIIEGGAFSGDTYTLSTPLSTSIGEKYLIVAGDVASTGNEVHYYHLATSFPITAGSTPALNWTGSVYNNSGVWTPQANSFAIESIGTETSSTNPYLYIQLQDTADNSNIEGLTVTLNDGTTNTTQSDGIAYFYNSSTQSFNVTDSNDLYFDYNSTSNPTENATTAYNVYGAFVTLNAYDVANNSVNTFNVSAGVQTNTTSSGTLNLYLVPNTTNTITVNGSGYISTDINISTSGQDTSSYNLSGLYQSVLIINAETYTGVQIDNQTTNVTGENLTLTETTTNYNTTFYVLYGDYNISMLPVGYSLQNETITISEGNNSPEVTLIVYALNSLYLYFYDEITNSLITENISVELITDTTAAIYYSTDGNLSLEVLTPEEYTLRYKSASGNNYTERDYYQTLSNNNYYNISLYLLEDTEATDMTVTIKDTSGDYVEGATVKLLRYFSNCACYKVVEMSKSSFSGESLFIVDSYDGHYKFSVDYQDTNRFLSTSSENFIPTAGLVERIITINLGSAYFQSFRELPSIGRSLTYNNVTGALTFTWSDPSGIVTKGCLTLLILTGYIILI